MPLVVNGLSGTNSKRLIAFYLAGQNQFVTNRFPTDEVVEAVVWKRVAVQICHADGVSHEVTFFEIEVNRAFLRPCFQYIVGIWRGLLRF